MSHSEMHKKKKKKNLVIFGLVLLWCAVIWMVTMIKLAKADEGSFYESRAAHQEHIVKTQEEWLQNRHDTEELRLKNKEKSEKRRASHYNASRPKQKEWWDEHEARQQEKIAPNIKDDSKA